LSQTLIVARTACPMVTVTACDILRSQNGPGTLGEMPRRPRSEAPGAIYHVVARGNGGCRIVLDDADRDAFVDRLARIADRFRWRVYAYCLMDTHLHLVVETPDTTLGVGMQRLIGGHAFQFNRRHGRSGHLFAGPYYALPIERAAHLTQACVYVVSNPVRAGLVQTAADWRWSSYRATAGLEPTPPFIRTEIIPDSLAADVHRARQIYREAVVADALHVTGSG
jgi:putative transposase